MPMKRDAKARVALCRRRVMRHESSEYDRLCRR